MAEYLIQDTTLDAIADAINAKTGKSAAMTPSEMATEIGNIPSGGGGGLDDYFTPVNCVTIRNGGTYGNNNGFVIPVAWNAVKKIEIKFKLADPNASHFIWATGGSPGTQPFFDKASVSGYGGGGSSTVITNETVDGITHYVLSLNATSSNKFWIGSWSDGTYSKTAAYYELKMWDENDNLLVDIQPSVSVVRAVASFLNKVDGIFSMPTNSFIAGEVLS